MTIRTTTSSTSVKPSSLRTRGYRHGNHSLEGRARCVSSDVYVLHSGSSSIPTPSATRVT